MQKPNAELKSPSTSYAGPPPLQMQGRRVAATVKATPAKAGDSLAVDQVIVEFEQTLPVGPNRNDQTGQTCQSENTHSEPVYYRTLAPTDSAAAHSNCTETIRKKSKCEANKAKQESRRVTHVPLRNSLRLSLPVAVFGRLSTNSISRGYL